MRSAARYGYVFFSWVFLIGVLVQVFLVGLVVVAGQMGWGLHGDLGHALGLPLILMLVLMYFGRLPSDIKRITWVLFGVYVLQADVVIFLRGSFPIVSALHPVFALIDFLLGWVLARRAISSLKESSSSTAAEPIIEGSQLG